MVIGLPREPSEDSYRVKNLEKSLLWKPISLQFLWFFFLQLLYFLALELPSLSVFILGLFDLVLERVKKHPSLGFPRLFARELSFSYFLVFVWLFELIWFILFVLSLNLNWTTLKSNAKNLFFIRFLCDTFFHFTKPWENTKQIIIVLHHLHLVLALYVKLYPTKKRFKVQFRCRKNFENCLKCQTLNWSVQCILILIVAFWVSKRVIYLSFKFVLPFA